MVAQYLILIYERESGYAEGGVEAGTEAMRAHGAYGEMLGAKMLGGNALQPEATATSIRGDGSGGFVVTDGPFAETKEALGGYYLVEAESLDEAITLGKACPAPFGGIEVRPIMVFS
jgi:hypothetical protein